MPPKSNSLPGKKVSVPSSFAIEIDEFESTKIQNELGEFILDKIGYSGMYLI